MKIIGSSTLLARLTSQVGIGFIWQSLAGDFVRNFFISLAVTGDRSNSGSETIQRSMFGDEAVEVDARIRVIFVTK